MHAPTQLNPLKPSNFKLFENMCKYVQCVKFTFLQSSNFWCYQKSLRLQKICDLVAFSLMHPLLHL